MAHFFIDRPIFAWVVAIMIMLGGGFALHTLPVAQYPNIASPEVAIRAFYPGASAKTVEESVTQVIEQQMKGIDNLMYMYSSSDSSGQCELNFAFDASANIDIAQVQVQNKLQLATPMLPLVVQRQGISVLKSVRNYLLVISLYSDDGSMENSDIGDYVSSYIQDPISRLSGVGETTVFGAQYAMRIWLDPEKMEQYKLNPSDIMLAITEQNEQVTGGQVGAGPALPGQEINLTINASSRLESTAQFESIFIRTLEDGAALLLKDVARVELNNERFTAIGLFNGHPSAGLAIKLASGANALETAARVHAEMDELAKFFPQGLKFSYAYDTAPIVEESINSVYRTLIEAIVLVFFIMYLFLQSFRATLIPTIAIPVVLLGTFGVLYLGGFTINTLTMFGMVLAIGLLVDDAIVVVENVERLMREEGLGPKEAAKKSMTQITGALVGVAMVISAVFVPMAFMGGSTGVIYRQFSITIVTAMTLSVIIAIVLTPALCATMLPQQVHHASEGLFGRFNRWFDRLTGRYQHKVGKLLVRPHRWLAIFAMCLGLIVIMFNRLPSSFLPEEDQSVLFINVQLPAGATFERSGAVMDTVRDYFLNEEADSVNSVFTVTGFSFSGAGQNAALAFVKLKPLSERRDKNQKVQALMRRAWARFGGMPEANVYAFFPPAVMELGSATGFDFEIIDRAGMGHDALMEARDVVLAKARSNPALRNVRHNGLNDVEQLELEIDLAKAGAQSLRKGEINTSIAAYWGGTYVNDFTDKGRTKKVFIQADAPFRMQASDFDKYYVRNHKGEMVPFSSFASMYSVFGSPRLERYQGQPSIEILGEAAEGYSSGQAMSAMENIAQELPSGFGYAWTSISYQEKLSGDQAPMLYTVSLIVVFLCLAALYESWTIPLSVLLVAPLGVLGALIGVWLRDMSNDIYFQIGFLTVVGLSAKNSILIVEFAKDLYQEGQELLEATRHAVRLRLRPIIMTSLCFVLGVIPLALSRSAGSGGQNALGTAVVFGVVTATALGIFYTPVFFVLVTKFFDRYKTKQASKHKTIPASADTTRSP
ncbi:efflux RND transporter permease subunit [Desulfovibrio sp. OttesenSCG-928-M14]|nr:efflux RND transporter permease subunit [Desulfovibrio sp. OttesenSCG-928-M14]